MKVREMIGTSPGEVAEAELSPPASKPDPADRVCAL